MKKIKLQINSREITANEGDSILHAALANNIYIPNLCDHPDLSPVGACRLCLVEIDGKIVTSCTIKVAAGMEVKTDSAEIEKIRKQIVELLLINHNRNCLGCARDNNCELQRVAQYVGIKKEDIGRYKTAVHQLPIDDSNPFFVIDRNKCIQCGRCIRTCDELQNLHVIDFMQRGYDTVVATFGDRPLMDSGCKSCGECAVRCPTGAMALKTHETPAYEVATTCPYCGCGCGLYLGVRGNKVVSARGVKECASNHGSLCVKGRFGFEFINNEKRLTKPLIKKDGKFVEASWEEALKFIADNFSKYKGKKFAMLASARATNEDNYVMQKFTRAVMGTNNIDHCARLCHAPTVAGLKQTFGSGAMTNSTDEIGDAKAILAIGTNTTEAHPIIALQVKKAAHNGAQLIVANPREIDLCGHATMFLQQKPGTDVVLIMGMAKAIVDENLHDEKFIKERCENFAEFKQSLENFDLEFVAKTTGVDADKIVDAARSYATNKPASILYAMGITQHSHGTDNVIALSNLALLTGNVGKASSGVNPLRGQNNVQGACDMGSLPNVYPGYQAVADKAMQEKFEKAWSAKLDDKAGWTHMEMLDAVDNGEIEAMYIVGENPIISEANSKHVASSLQKLKCLVVQDIFLNETAEYADVVLPAASFAEKNGTFTNTERRVQRVQKAIDPVGESVADWQIVCNIAKQLGAKGFDFANAEEIMQEIVALTPSYHGINYQRLEKGGLQWPCLDEKHPGTKYLHKEKFATKSGKGKFMALTYRPSVEVADAEYPYILTTDRSLFHYHTATMTRKVKGLTQIVSHETVRINPKDAEKLQIKDGEMIKVISRRGEVSAAAKITTTSPPGVIAMTFHFAESPTNVVTNPALDPLAKIPETKVTAVKIEK